MKCSWFNRSCVVLLLFVATLAIATTSVWAQTQTTGAFSGTVADQTGAVVPGATVTVTDVSTSSKQVVKTDAEGRYTVGLLKPGAYKLTASTAGMQSNTVEASAVLSTTIGVDIKVTATGNQTIVEVNSTTLPLVDTENVALATTFTEQQIQELPTPGGDVTTIAFTAPGVVVNVGGAYGNFSSDGLPGISNLFVLNGFDNQDPFLNLNNSGSSNLTLGQGELGRGDGCSERLQLGVWPRGRRYHQLHHQVGWTTTSTARRTTTGTVPRSMRTDGSTSTMRSKAASPMWCPTPFQ